MARDLYTTSTTRGRTRSEARWGRFVVLAALVAAVAAGWLYLGPTPSGDKSAPATVVIRQGSGWDEATAALHDQGLVRRPLTFKAIVLLSGARGALLPGSYTLHKGTSSRDLIATLTDPEAGAALVIPEGWRLEQIGAALEGKKLSTPEQWNAAIGSPPASLVLRSLPASVDLEGYIYPGSYAFAGEDAAAELVRSGLRNLEQQLTPTVMNGLSKQGLTIHEGLTVASIVEREAQVPEERAVIASVYLNRLKAGMRLQADPTTQYAVGVPGAWWKIGLTKTDLSDPSPYNTYAHEGLPPGPICSPGIASIQAVAQPARTEYLYFVARGDGSHAFATTYAEHEANIRRYQGR